MALFSYNEFSPEIDRDTVRMLLADTDGSVATGARSEWSFYLTDGEIDRALAMAGDVYGAAAQCCRMLAANDLQVNKAVRLGQFSTSNEAAGHWRAMAEQYSQQAGLATGGDTAEVAWDEFAELDIRRREAYEQ